MFPGSGRHSYNNLGNYQNNYGPPQGPPPGNYGPPQGPPPGGYYGGPPPGPPPQSWQPQGGNLNLPQFQQQQVQYQHQQSQAQSQHQQYDRQSAPAPNGSYDSSGHYTGNAYQAPMGAPPTAPQSFGQNSNMTFQYSNCTGKKKALLIGINYYGTKNELRGCVNDVKNMSRFLNQYYGYLYDDMVILTDDQRENARLPTRANIIRAMQWLTKNASPNDSYFFHMSSHGGLVPDQDGDEESGFDSCVYPLDFETAGPIIDDEMHDLMVKPLPPGCRLVALFDACHSGTALDLPFVYLTKGVVKEPNLWKDAGTGALQAIMNYETGNILGAMSAVSGIFKKVSNHKSTDRDRIIQSKMSSADVISLSGCKDDQTSADATEAGKSTGAMSWAFISVLTQSTNQSYLSLLNNMRNMLATKYSQKPQLSASHPQDMNLAFIM
ncbi:Caspase domain-containing protein [Metschnikowia aff. pulcherrima]|uniref:Metacaspase-1 n=1 Tax=Metschnikowia aff. pulcherrima TaxID=2163413 RepID=A0A4P6XL02_9ASCO|nr:Caspase domain-containing protein [Metschnikowia aff. pulcherrima]